MDVSADPRLSYSGHQQWTWEIPFKGWVETTGLVKEAFQFRAQIAVFSEEIDEILFSRAPELAKRNRSRYALALQRLTGFLGAIGFSKLVQGELVQLALALNELDNGIVRDFLKPSFVPRKAEHPGDKWIFRAELSIAVHLLVHQGFSRKKASRLVAKCVEPTKLVIAPTVKTLHLAIESWHRQFSCNSVRNEIARSMFENGEQLVSATVEYLRNITQREPTISDVAVEIALGAVSSAIWAATQDEHDAAYEVLRRRKISVSIRRFGV